jgi:sulfotransferase
LNKTLHFLSGVPRSGSTVLAAILNQNPQTHVSTTSGLGNALDGLATTWHQTRLLVQNDPERHKLASTMRGVIDAFYETTDKPVVIDKARNWPIPVVMQAMAQVLGRKMKIIATVRSVPDCMASFIRIAKPDNLDDFILNGSLAKHLKGSYLTLQQGYSYDPESFLFVEYEDLLADPKAQLDRIHAFLELPAFDYDFRNIDGTPVKEDDENLHGYAGLHDIKPVLQRQHNDSPKDVLKHHYPQFCQPEFWLDRPRTVPDLHDLDLQLAASRMGDFAEGWRLCQKIEAEEPDNHRAAYNRGWYMLRQGQIQKGYQLMDRGRIVGVFGNSKPDVPTQPWDGKSKGIVMLYLEGGLGDQIHQVRYAKPIAERGCKVIVSCTGPLASLFTDVAGVSAVIQHEASFGIYHDFYVQGMSAVVPLGFNLNDLSGKPYLTKPKAIRGHKKRIGLRWQGQSAFENEHQKKFPYDLMFDAVKDADAEFVSLQRDEGADACPSWVKQVPLDSWEDTRNAVASCDLVISSCTSVSHLSAAMGVETWVVTPVMPYFLYALEGETCPYYDTMKLMRQEVFGDWTAPFEKIKERLGEKQALRRVK